MQKSGRAVRMVLGVVAAAAASSALVLALAAYAGLWAWREWFPHRGEHAPA